MIKTGGSISTAKQTVQSLYNKQVSVTVDLGRNKKINFLGQVSGVYPALFTVSPNDKDFKGKTSYSYSEYLCGRVTLTEQA